MAIWTPDALASEARRLAGRCWRVVEAQHIVSTLKLVDTLDEQLALEEWLEESKPPVPPECRNLHYLLWTPFRYDAPYPSGSRFRRAGFTAGIFYGSDTVRTAVAEMAFHRLLFFAESPDMPWPVNASEYSAFMVRFRTGAGIDLTTAPLSRDGPRWMHPTDYSACQELADNARAAGIEVVRYASARTDGRNVALLICHAFSCKEPLDRQVWRLHLGPAGVRAICDHPDERHGFDRLAFATDPRIARLRWDR